MRCAKRCVTRWLLLLSVWFVVLCSGILLRLSIRSLRTLASLVGVERSWGRLRSSRPPAQRNPHKGSAPCFFVAALSFFTGTLAHRSDDLQSPRHSLLQRKRIQSRLFLPQP